MDFNSFRYGLVLGFLGGIVIGILGFGAWLHFTEKINRWYEEKELRGG